MLAKLKHGAGQDGGRVAGGAQHGSQISFVPLALRESRPLFL
ncbi:hypothetical protein [Luteimonas mephitis]